MASKTSKLAKRDALIDAIFALTEKVADLERRQAKLGNVIRLRERLAEQLCINRRLMAEKAAAWGVRAV